MKQLLVLLITVMSFGAANTSQAQIHGGISFNTFYNELSPYGRWIDNPQYGQVWISNQQGFEPYYDNGRWDYTSYGWTWISDYPWGWAPFHYGRWAFTSYGWAWVPGYEWGPAWVGWAQNNGYYGWAPLSPGLGMNISFNSIPSNRWRFVQHQYINSPTIQNHFIRPDRNPSVYNNITIINNTTVVNNNNYSTGPQRADVERATKRTIITKQVAFDETKEQTRVDKNQVRMYRPLAKQNVEGLDKPADSRPGVAVPIRPKINTGKESAVPLNPADEQQVRKPLRRTTVPIEDEKLASPQQRVSKEVIATQPVSDNPVERKIQQQELERSALQQLKQQQEKKAVIVDQRSAEDVNVQQENIRRQQMEQQRVNQQQAAAQAQKANQFRAQEEAERKQQNDRLPNQPVINEPRPQRPQQQRIQQQQVQEQRVQQQQVQEQRIQQQRAQQQQAQQQRPQQQQRVIQPAPRPVQAAPIARPATPPRSQRNNSVNPF